MKPFEPVRRQPAAPPVTPPARKDIGALGEKLAREHIEKHGYRVIETNYRGGRLGELDIIALHKKELVFLEVRTTTGASFGIPEESITEIKKKRLASLALFYLQCHAGLPENWRVDMVAVELDKSLKPKRIEIIENCLE